MAAHQNWGSCVHLSLLSLISDGLEKCKKWGPVLWTRRSWWIRLHLHQRDGGKGRAGGRIEAHKWCAALHVCSEAGGEGGRPGGETHQCPNQPVNWQRWASTVSIEGFFVCFCCCLLLRVCGTVLWDEISHDYREEFLSLSYRDIPVWLESPELLPSLLDFSESDRTSDCMHLKKRNEMRVSDLQHSSR